MAERLTRGARRIRLTVPDLAGTLGFDVVGGVPDYPTVLVSDGTTVLTLRRTSRRWPRAFRRVRAHPGAVIEFAPEPMRPGSATRHFMGAIPGGVRLGIATPFT